MNTQIPKSFFPSYGDEDTVRRSWVRAIAASALATARHEPPGKVLQRAWPDDTRAAIFHKAATSPIDTTAFPTADAVAGFRSLAPGSAALALFQRGLALDLAGVTTIRIPNIASLPVKPIFVAEGARAPDVQFTLAATIVGPVRKILVLSAVTGELEKAAPESAAQVIGRVLADAAGKSFDTVAFGTADADAAQPAGLLHNVTPVTATAGGGMAAMVEDLANLIEAIGDAGIDTNDVVIVAPPHQATTMKAMLGIKFTNPILTTLGLPANTVAAFAPAAVASGYQNAPTIETSKEALVHLEDTSPQDIGTPGSPATVAAPTKSMFQTDLISIKVRANAAWAVTPGGAQFVENVTW
jgi:hypothetical protein